MKLKDVKCEYVIKNGDCISTEDFKRDWDAMTDEQKQGWYTTTRETYRVKADDVIDRILEDMGDVGYEEMDVVVSDMCIDDEKTKELQSILDKIFSGSVMYIYYPDKEIEV